MLSKYNKTWHEASIWGAAIMDRRQIIELLVLGLWLTIAAVLYIQTPHNDPKPITNKLLPQISDSDQGKIYEIKKITVVSGDSFDLTIKDGNDSRILVKLTVVAVENAKGKVIDVLNHCIKPKIALKEKQPNGYWTVDLFVVTKQGEEINLAEWLTANKLVYK